MGSPIKTSNYFQKTGSLIPQPKAAGCDAESPAPGSLPPESRNIASNASYKLLCKKPKKKR